MLPDELLEALEELVDKTTLYAVVDALSTVADLKADHIRHTWQDNITAKAWDDAGRALSKAAVRAEGI